MSKRMVHEVSQAERKRSLKEFYKMVSDIKKPQEVANFFRDLLTPSESLMITRRIMIAKMLLRGKSYEEISKALRVGASTISNVYRWLYSGFGGYMKEITELEKKEKIRNTIPTTDWEMIKKKYPAHFLIANIIDKLKK